MKEKKIGEELHCLICEKGDDINIEVTNWVEKNSIPSGSIQVIGAIEDITLGWFDPETEQYINTFFPGEFELVSCMGNISHMDGKPFIHLHAVISDRYCRTFGGHLFSSTVAVTGEVFVHLGEEKLKRVKSGAFGLITI